jgi:hypothetical protein
LTPQQAAEEIHRVLCRLTPVGRMIMMRMVRHEFDPDGSKKDTFDAGLKYGHAEGWFVASELALFRKV